MSSVAHNSSSGSSSAAVRSSTQPDGRRKKKHRGGHSHTAGSVPSRRGAWPAIPDDAARPGSHNVSHTLGRTAADVFEHLRGLPGAARALPDELKFGRSATELLAATPETPAWLIPDVAARGWMVKIAGREKVGKGKLIFTTLGHLERGESTVFGDAAEPATAVIYTEEPEDSIREKVAEAGLVNAFIVFGYELSGLGWNERVDALIREAGRGGHAVLFIDNVSRAAAAEDEAGVELARAAEYLGEQGKAAGLTILIDNHHRKAGGKLEDKSRGGTALAGACDNNIEIELVGDWNSRVRRLSSRGRVSATIWTRTVTLAEDGRRYELVADTDEPQSAAARSRLDRLRDYGTAGTTAKTFAAAIDQGEDTARRALGNLVQQGHAHKDDGRPARYFADAAI